MHFVNLNFYFKNVTQFPSCPIEHAMAQTVILVATYGFIYETIYINYKTPN